MGPTAASAGQKASEKDGPTDSGFPPFSLLPNLPQAVPRGQATVTERTPGLVFPSVFREAQGTLGFHLGRRRKCSLSDIIISLGGPSHLHKAAPCGTSMKHVRGGLPALRGSTAGKPWLAT